MNKKIYIEIGGNDGRRLEMILKGKEVYDNYYVFEPHPELYKIMVDKFSQMKNVTIYDWCASDKDGNCNFYFSTTRNDGSTIVSGKITGKVDYNNPIIVKCIDIGKWMSEKFAGDIIDVRMDIEGGEYMVIPKMIDDGSIFLLNSLSIEFHDNRFKDVSIKDTHKKIINFLNTNKINYKIEI